MEDTLNFKDIFKKSMLELDAFKNVSWVEIFWGLLISFLLGMFIYFVYQRCFRGVVYSHNYNVSFVLMTLITTLIIMTISTNIVLSLGMVGALSIVRFRTAVKDPLDIVYMFWAISVGIATGAKLYPIAIFGSLFIALVVFLLSRRKVKTAPFLLILHYEEALADEGIKTALRKMKYTLKSKTIRKQMTELTVELRINADNTAFVQSISEIPGVADVALVSYNGDYAP
ncbi:conserved hypothetical protein [Paenibacillus curdlanolyticus YK9]|uniref:DUF4956 domain-containing protein n=1 Tax=Paenibacillus curdlanolyticus YK9 TaxID=717606 RepID=E0I9V8_9BACL|nr:DUF4956 domain-containing protein [Paenibacillus curdlanolyticus]EFM10535.1 conserved hypothetical protein [Paenibacillus curdlanolyticus YK9]